MNEDRLSAYDCLDEFGTELLARVSEPRRVRLWRLFRRRRSVIAATLMIALGGGTATAVALLEGEPDRADSLAESIAEGDSVPILQEARDAEGNVIFDAPDCAAYDEWFIANVAPAWHEGYYTEDSPDPALDEDALPEPPPGICG